MAWFDHAFNHFETADVDNYGLHMPRNPEIGERIRCEAIFEDKKYRSLFISTADRSTHLFILSIFKETWVSELEDADTYFNSVSAKALLGNLTDNCNGLNGNDTVNIHLAMPSQ